MRSRDEAETVSADYFTEEVRRQLAGQFGDEKVLEGGLAVKTSLDPRMQDIATRALREGLIDYDRRQRGWRGPVAHLPTLQSLQLQLGKIARSRTASADEVRGPNCIGRGASFRTIRSGRLFTNLPTF
jgi:penicillin-binding protein 1A